LKLGETLVASFSHPFDIRLLQRNPISVLSSPLDIRFMIENEGIS